MSYRIADPDTPGARSSPRGRRRLSGATTRRIEAEELLARAAATPPRLVSRPPERARGPGGSRRLRGARRAPRRGRASAIPPRRMGVPGPDVRRRPARADPPRRDRRASWRRRAAAAAGARRIVDLGTGSGILAVSLALERPARARRRADRSPAALALAAANARRHGVRRARASPSRPTGSRAFSRRPLFDLVVANPPYVPLADAPHLSKTVSGVRAPSRALRRGDGLDPLRVLLAALPAFLAKGAPFVFEFGYGQANDVSALVEAVPAPSVSTHMRLDAAGIHRRRPRRRAAPRRLRPPAAGTLPLPWTRSSSRAPCRLPGTVRRERGQERGAPRRGRRTPRGRARRRSTACPTSRTSRTMERLLAGMGVSDRAPRAGAALVLDASRVASTEAPYDLVRDDARVDPRPRARSWRASARRASRSPAAARSACGPSTSTSWRSRRWGRAIAVEKGYIHAHVSRVSPAGPALGRDRPLPDARPSPGTENVLFAAGPRARARP